MLSHKVVKCMCGAVLSQCRCVDCNKTVEISTEPCPHKDRTGAVEPKPEDFIRDMKGDSVNRLPAWEQGGMILAPSEDGEWLEYVPLLVLETVSDRMPDARLEDIVRFLKAAVAQSKATILSSEQFKYINRT